MENLEELLTLDTHAKTIQVKKGEILQREGELASLVFFVKKGLLRSYKIDAKGKEHIFMFASEGWIAGDMESHEFHKPTDLFLDCLEDSELVVFDRKCFKIAMQSEAQLKRNAELLSRRVGVMQRRIIMLLSASAKERYQSFLKTYPDLPNRVPQRMIASYLGITPEALSRIRGERINAGE